MKPCKQEAFFDLVGDLVAAGVGLGRAQERHAQAAADEQDAGAELAELSQEFAALVTGDEPATLN